MQTKKRRAQRLCGACAHHRSIESPRRRARVRGVYNISHQGNWAAFMLSAQFNGTQNRCYAHAWVSVFTVDTHIHTQTRRSSAFMHEESAPHWRMVMATHAHWLGEASVCIWSLSPFCQSALPVGKRVAALINEFVFFIWKIAINSLSSLSFIVLNAC